MAKVVINEGVELTPQEIPIEKNIPMPRPVYRGRPRKYRWHEMDIGDSFLFPDGLALSTCRTMAWDAGRKLGRKFSVMQTSDGIRCWRIPLKDEGNGME